MLPTVTALLAIFAILVAKLALNVRNNGRKQLPYPPGPKPKFLIGNALDIPSGESSRTFAGWGKRFKSAFIRYEMEGKKRELYDDRRFIACQRIRNAYYNNQQLENSGGPL